MVICGVFSLIETKTSIPDGLYWAIVTASTVGLRRHLARRDRGPGSRGLPDRQRHLGRSRLTALFAGWVLEAKLEDHLGTPDLHDDFDHMIGQLQALKRRYAQDEDADDRIADAARAAHAEWKSSPDGEQCGKAMKTLEEALKHDY